MCRSSVIDCPAGRAGAPAGRRVQRRLAVASRVWTVGLVGLLGLVTACADATLVNRAPTAFAGFDRSVLLGQSLVLDGLGSDDPEGQALSYRWSMQTPDGRRAELGGGAVLDIRLSQQGLHLFFLQVSDGELQSAPDLLSVMVVSAEASASLVARAGDGQRVPARGVAQLDGSGSFGGEGRALRFWWQLVDRPDGALADTHYVFAQDPTAPEHANLAVLSPSLSGAFVFSLRVESEGVLSDPDFVTVGVEGWSQAVRAEAQPAQRFALAGDEPVLLTAEARLFSPTGSAAGTAVEWWVLSAPEGPDCPFPGDRLTEGTSVETVTTRAIARLRMPTRCAGVWQLLICPEGAAPACPAANCCPHSDTGRAPLTASCCKGLADRLVLTVEEPTP